MMLKSVAFSPSAPGKALWSGGRLKALSTSLGGISAAFRPPPSKQQLAAAAPFSVSRVVDEFSPRNAQALLTRTSKFRSFHRKPGHKMMSASLQEGGSAHKLHHPWLLFGVCLCLSAAAGSLGPRLLSPPPAFAEIRKQEGVATSTGEAQGKKNVHFDYHVTGIPGDGRCLFRAVAHGACLRSGRPAPDESTQRQMADDLRNKALDELVKRRESSEWFIEGDFDAYVKRMRKPHTWGGEPELLMLSNVLQMPITVYMKDKGGIISIAEYGQEHGSENPVRVLYHGHGHYEAVHLPEDKHKSRL